jgi:predicted DNA-binding transcriptional regulator AlpA
MMNEMTPKHRWLTAPQVRQRFGGRSDAWLWRILHDDPNFPRPMVIKQMRYWDENEIEAYEETRRA